MKLAATLTLNMILASTFVASSAFAQGFAATQDGKEITSSRTQFNTTLPQAPVSNFTLVPAIAFGGSGLANVETTDSSEHYNQASASRYEAGLLAEYGRHTFVFQSGLLYLNEGLKYNVQYAPPNTTSYQSTDISGSAKYLAIPVVGKARVRIAEGVRLSARAGVMAAFLMGAKADYTTEFKSSFSNNVLASTSSSQTDTSGLRSVNAIAVIGLGPEIRVAHNQNIRIEGNYERYLMAFQEAAGDKVTFQSWNAMLSYGVGF